MKIKDGVRDVPKLPEKMKIIFWSSRHLCLEQEKGWIRQGQCQKRIEEQHEEIFLPAFQAASCDQTG
jgi:hypothetical protein